MGYRNYNRGTPNILLATNGSLIQVNSGSIEVFQEIPSLSGDSISGFRCFFESTTGTQTNILQGDLYELDAVTGEPTGSSLATATGTPINQNYANFTFGSAYSNSSSKRYGIKIKNVAGVPGSNHFTVSQTLGDTSSGFRLSPTNEWTAFNVNASIWAIYTTDGEVQSMQGRTSSTSVGASFLLYNPSGDIRRHGYEVQFDEDVYFGGVEFIFAPPAGTTGWPLIAEICDSSSVLATSVNKVRETDGTRRFNFDPYLMLAGTSYFVVARVETLNVGDSSNYERIGILQNNMPSNCKLGPIRNRVQSTSSTPSFTVTGSIPRGGRLIFWPASGDTGQMIARGILNGGYL